MVWEEGPVQVVKLIVGRLIEGVSQGPAWPVALATGRRIQSITGTRMCIHPNSHRRHFGTLPNELILISLFWNNFNQYQYRFP